MVQLRFCRLVKADVTLVLYDTKLLFIKDTKLADTIPYDKDVNDELIKDTRLAETVPYDNDVNDELIKDTRLVFVFVLQ